MDLVRSFYLSIAYLILVSKNRICTFNTKITVMICFNPKRNWNQNSSKSANIIFLDILLSYKNYQNIKLIERSLSESHHELRVGWSWSLRLGLNMVLIETEPSLQFDILSSEHSRDSNCWGWICSKYKC